MMGAPCNTLFMRCLEYLADSDSGVGTVGEFADVSARPSESESGWFTGDTPN